MELRAYQKDAVNQIRQHYKKSCRKVLLHLPTGSGKTVIFSFILKSLVERGKKGVMVVHGRHLVEQAADRLRREQVPYGIIMGNHKDYNTSAPVQVCSIDTLRSRGLVPPADLVVIDECHMATSKSYKDLVGAYPAETFFLPVTATPYTPKPLRHIADVVVSPISFDDLITQGYLVPPVYYAPFSPDLTDVGTSRATHDYNQDELAKVMDQKALVGDLITNWSRYAGGLPTVCFAVSVKHSKSIVRQFCDAGIPAEHVEASTPLAERQLILERLRRGVIKIISNVGILCTGVDIPFLRCILMARPTKSLCLYIQQVGRGTRPCDDKSNFILLDHAGNIMRHGFVEDEKEALLDGVQRRKKDAADDVEVPKLKTCSICFAVISRGISSCPVCGFGFDEKKVKRELEEIDGELKRIERTKETKEIADFIAEKKKIQKRCGYKRGWVYYQLKARYGEVIADKYMPRRKVPHWVRRDKMKA